MRTLIAIILCSFAAYPSRAVACTGDFSGRGTVGGAVMGTLVTGAGALVFPMLASSIDTRLKLKHGIVWSSVGGSVGLTAGMWGAGSYGTCDQAFWVPTVAGLGGALVSTVLWGAIVSATAAEEDPDFALSVQWRGGRNASVSAAFTF